MCCGVRVRKFDTIARHHRKNGRDPYLPYPVIVRFMYIYVLFNCCVYQEHSTLALAYIFAFRPLSPPGVQSTWQGTCSWSSGPVARFCSIVAFQFCSTCSPIERMFRHRVCAACRGLTMLCILRGRHGMGEISEVL